LPLRILVSWPVEKLGYEVKTLLSKIHSYKNKDDRGIKKVLSPIPTYQHSLKKEHDTTYSYSWLAPMVQRTRNYFFYALL